MRARLRGAPARHLIRGIALGVLCLAALAAPGAFAHAGIHAQIDAVSGRIAQDPGDPRLYLQRGDLYRIHQDWEHALADFRRAGQLAPAEPAVELGIGRTRLDQGLPEQAIPHLDRALVHRPDHVRTLITRARAYRALDRPLDAAADYSRAIDQFSAADKPLPEYYLERARALAAAGDAHIGEALQGLDAGMRVLGGLRTLARYAVELEARRGHFNAALERLDAVLAGAGRREFLLSERGDILAAAGRDGEARQAYLAAREAAAGLPARYRRTPLVRELEAALAARLTAADDAP